MTVYFSVYLFTKFNLRCPRDDIAGLVKLYEAKTNAYEELTDCMRVLVYRDFIVEDTLKLYREKKIITSCKLEEEFRNEPAEDLDGLTRELFSQMWKNVLPMYFKGTTFHAPRVDLDCSEELFELLGRIATHGFLLTGFFPVSIAPATVISLFDSDALKETDVMYCFLSFLSEGEQQKASEALQKRQICVDDTLLDMLSRFNVRNIPSTVAEFNLLFLRIAK